MTRRARVWSVFIVMPRGFPAERFEGDRVRLRTAAYTGVERVDRGQLAAGELEVEDIDVLRDP
jgi:hypothetical protein